MVTLSLPVTGMTCSNCALIIERNLSKMNGIINASVDFASEKLMVSFDAELINKHDIIAQVTYLGYDVDEDEKWSTTKRQELVDSLIESEISYRILFEHSPVGISKTGIDGTLKVNQSYCNLFGYTEEELHKLKWMDITHPDDVLHSHEMLQLLLDGKESQVRFEKRYIHKNGNIVWGDICTHLQRDKFNNPQFYITTINDITVRKRAEEHILKLNNELEQRIKERTAALEMQTTQLEFANKELESFNYSVSHDLRAPLRALSGFASILMEDYADRLGAEGNRLLNVIQFNAQKMSRLIDDLLRFSRLSRHELKVNKIDMYEMANSVYNEIATDEDKQNIDFQINAMPEAYGDAPLVRQVWINLISNAIKFSAQKPNRTIEIGCTTHETENTYYVKDNGAGFDMANEDKLFGVFQRLHNASEFEGTGIGLAIVYRVITRMNGRVWAIGIPNEGATFYFTL